MFGVKLLAVLCLTFVLTLVGSLVFLRGFLLSRTVVEQTSRCDEDFVLKADDHSGHGLEGCWMHGRFKRAIVIVIDALRYDFMAYNESLNSEKYTIAPYENKLKIIHDLEKKKPLHTLKLKFMADPPTTTLQRLKGLTTGSLPTFVDAGANFQSSEITEDNIIDHMLRENKNVTFLGDDTWMGLFPKRFHKHYDFPSFDVKDLHTVDNGILNHLYHELERPDWNVIIAHFLGVDHCGHRYGPNHEAMRDKLLQMNEVIRNVTRQMQKDTILFVMGDHGMTKTGDHGGDSEDELEAGLFIYSPTQILSHKQAEVATVSQTDFVPTISLLLGLPIPFSNLGMVIPELFSHCPWWDMGTNEVRSTYHRVKALRLNVLQINRYLQEYQKVASDLPSYILHDLRAQIRQAEHELKQIVPDLLSGAHPEKVLKQFQSIENIYKLQAQTAKETCQGVWAKFDLKLIFTGILVILCGGFVGLFYSVAWKQYENAFSFSSLFLAGGSLLLIIEEKHSCTDSFFSTPLSGVDKALVNQRYVFSLFCLAVMVYLVRQWLKYYGNMTGSEAGVITMRYAPPVAAVCIGLYWALQAVPDSAVETLTPWQQAVLAQAVYVVVILALILIIVSPLLIYNHPTSMPPGAAIFNQSDLTSVIPSLYNQLKVQLSSSHEDQKPPVVYGLGSVYCASMVALLSLVSLVLALLLGDGMAPSLTVAIVSLFLCLELYSSFVAISNEKESVDRLSDEGSGQSSLFLGLVMLNLLSSTFFYATGHQPTIPSIRFESAFTGFYGNFSNMILPGLLIWLNTFAGPVFFALACPLLITWPALKGFLMRWMTQSVDKQQSEKWQGDFQLYNNGIQLRKDMFQACCGLITISGFKVGS
ncbi:GPI ethanolamine phosphate transferase 3-like [Elysia marginata]|uniref:GPI ethanolamine phosphate transferase 3, catalytic subunit n=1 Tax=Elysia marginata TaxID=1093978 RepID=A0AAV4IH48_9GAST|nr:GPI ethanolamine phosphate transferase 3-like [Elysia marginata]